VGGYLAVGGAEPGGVEQLEQISVLPGGALLEFGGECLR
jgi:hypothetical protein